MMNIDINKDVVVGFDPDGRPLNHLGETLSDGGGKKRMLFSAELLNSLREARKLIEPE